MSGWTLHLKTNAPGLIDAGPLVPDNLALLDKDALVRVAVSQGSSHVPLGSLFDISGAPGEGQLCIDGAKQKLVRVGAEMRTGHLKIAGSVGDQAGSGMKGGTLSIDGDSGDYLGSDLRGGCIRVSGNAGHFVAGAEPGKRYGMRGGSLIVHGNVGDRLADRLRRGTVIVAGNCGQYAASRVVAGTIVIGGKTGRSLATGMRRGTLLRANSHLTKNSDQESKPDLPGFEPSGPMSTTFTALLLASIDKLYGNSDWRAHAKKNAVNDGIERWVGDRRVEGRAELLQFSTD